MSSKYALTGLISGSVLILDQITKLLVDRTMTLHQSIEVFPNFVHLTYLRNTGAAFGFLAGRHSNLRIIFFGLISVVAIGCIGYLLRSLRPQQKTLLVSLSLILGGAVGNLIDRLRLGEVIDFIDLHWYHVHWPAFNVADSAISIGVVLLFIRMVRKGSLTFGEKD
ncbi:MAG TPA: signal peptidase II [Candidatus Acidoferrum sp.]|nr:signal peptidase II [Candidatus Acidoferrum sp.]